ncbi:MAG: hypothetical protein EPO37_02150 [Nitrosarchaeum sp.]|nr:MAG: hypothetical protein EPO37_02150 [Nitrosarchaeum sp.]
MKYLVLLLILIGFTGIAFATHDPTQPYIHSIILPFDMKEKTFEEFMEWCKPYYGEKCTELYEKNLVSNVLPPLKQIKSGIALVDVKCNEGNVPAIRYDRIRVACVSLDTESKLVLRGWATMRLAMPGDNISEALCNNYGGKWHQEHNGCRDISDLQCSLIGGKFTDLKICEDGICPDKRYTVCVIETKKLDWKMINSEFPMTPLVFQVSKDEKIFDVEYGINGGMIKNMTFSNHTNSILVEIDSADEGNLVLGMPRNLLDAKMDYCPPHLDNPPDDRFFVILDGEEIWYDEILTTNEMRVLQIKFAENSTKLEIISGCLI